MIRFFSQQTLIKKLKVKRKVLMIIKEECDTPKIF